MLFAPTRRSSRLSGSSIPLVRGTVIHFLHNEVATKVKRETDLRTQASFCYMNTFLSKCALDLLTEYNYNASDPKFSQPAAFAAIQSAKLEPRGCMLTNDELSRLSELNMTAISCQLNGQSCEFDFFFNYTSKELDAIE